jgi:hypothetical protein
VQRGRREGQPLPLDEEPHAILKQQIFALVAIAWYNIPIDA